MAKLLTHGKRVTVVEYGLFFQRKNVSYSGGYEFDCDEHGRLGDMTAMQKESYADAQSDAYYAGEVRRRSHSYWEPASMECTRCGTVLHLHDAMSNDCTGCDNCYNSSGQQVIKNYGREECERDGWAYDVNDY